MHAFVTPLPQQITSRSPYSLPISSIILSKSAAKIQIDPLMKIHYKKMPTIMARQEVSPDIYKVIN
jgi:hypothetical protein